MAGFSASLTKKLIGGAVTADIPHDSCDLKMRIDLVGVRSEVSRVLSVGEVLEVALIGQGRIRSAVCRRAGGEIVGTLAAFRGLAKLIACMGSGVVYGATVEAASAVRCSVAVARIR